MTTPNLRKHIVGLIATAIGFACLYAMLAWLVPGHLMHREMFTLGEGWPTKPGKLTLLIGLIATAVGAVLRALRLPRWVAYPAAGATMLLLACHACQLRGEWLKMPDLDNERYYAADAAAWQGDWQRVQSLTREEQDSRLLSYYHYLSLAHQGRLADSLFAWSQPKVDDLFYPIDEHENYATITAASEVWWWVNDLTMAEHATMLGMIFSPGHTGRRPLQRLYEINLASGNRASAQKFARILNIEDVMPEASDSEPKVADSDALRLSGQYGLMLRSTLERNPKNLPALEYLLCLDLVRKDLNGFRQDFGQWGWTHPSHTFQEALLILMDANPELREPWHDYIDASTYHDFVQFRQQCGPKPKADRVSAYRHTYWYYFLFAQ